MTSKLTIAFFSDTFYPQINGIVSSLLNLTKSLADNGHKIFIVAPKADSEIKEFEYPGITILRISSIKASFYEDFRWTKIMSLSTLKILKKSSVNIIHFETPSTLGIMAINISKLLNIPLVGTYHTFLADPRYIRHLKIFKPTILIQNITWFYTNQLFNKTDLTTAPAYSTILEMQQNGCNANIIKNISNGIDPSPFKNIGSSKIIEKYKLTDKTILYVGRVSQEKNIEILLQAFFYSASKDDKVKLLIVGAGPQLDEIKELSKNSPYKDRIIFTGSINHTELIESGIYGACQIFATASETENQSMSILEAQVNGLICIGVNARGNPELIKNNKNGIIVEPGDYVKMGEAFLTILNDKALFSSMKKETYSEIQNHFLSNILEQWEEEYINLINNFKGRRFRDRLFLPK